jgi:hypothetical protein
MQTAPGKALQAVSACSTAGSGDTTTSQASATSVVETTTTQNTTTTASDGFRCRDRWQRRGDH